MSVHGNRSAADKATLSKAQGQTLSKAQGQTLSKAQGQTETLKTHPIPVGVELSCTRNTSHVLYCLVKLTFLLTGYIGSFLETDSLKRTSALFDKTHKKLNKTLKPRCPIQLNTAS